MPIATSAVGDPPSSLKGPTSTSWVGTWLPNLKGCSGRESEVGEVFAASNPFIYTISSVVPADQDSPLVSRFTGCLNNRLEDFPPFLIRNVYLASLVTADAVAFLFDAHHCGFSSGRGRSCCLSSDNNTVCFLPTGELFLQVDLSTYQRMGLSGFDVKQAFVKDNNCRLLKIDTCALTKHPRCSESRRYQRLQWALGYPQMDSLELSGFFDAPLTLSKELFAATLTKILRRNGSPNAEIVFGETTVTTVSYTGGTKQSMYDTSTAEGDIFSVERQDANNPIALDPLALRAELLETKEQEHLAGAVEEVLHYVGKLFLDVAIDPYECGWVTPSTAWTRATSFTCIHVRGSTRELVGSGVARAFLTALLSECPVSRTHSCSVNASVPTSGGNQYFPWWICSLFGSLEAAECPAARVSAEKASPDGLKHKTCCGDDPQHDLLGKAGKVASLPTREGCCLDTLLYLPTEDILMSSEGSQCPEPTADAHPVVVIRVSC